MFKNMRLVILFDMLLNPSFKGIVITKPDKGNGVVILDRKLYSDAIEEIISDSSKFEKLDEEPTLKREASLQHLLRIWKYGNVTVKDFQKYEKLESGKNKLKLDIDFLNYSKQLRVYPKFLIVKLPNVSNKNALSICKRLLRSAINKCNKEL